MILEGDLRRALIRRLRVDREFAIASEPFGDAGDTWQPVPPGSIMTATSVDVSFNEFVVA